MKAEYNILQSVIELFSVEELFSLAKHRINNIWHVYHDCAMYIEPAHIIIALWNNDKNSQFSFLTYTTCSNTFYFGFISLETLHFNLKNRWYINLKRLPRNYELQIRYLAMRRSFFQEWFKTWQALLSSKVC